MNKKESTLYDALRDAFICDIPELWNNEDIWIKAVGLITKSNTTQNYCLLKRDSDGNAQVVKDYGDICKIVKINEIRPYIFLNNSYICEFKNKQERIDYILNNKNEYKEGDLQTMKKDELQNICINIWIDKQLNNK
jgi:hypothetical protein